jgi:hypothetical protein
MSHGSSAFMGPCFRRDDAEGASANGGGGYDKIAPNSQSIVVPAEAGTHNPRIKF